MFQGLMVEGPELMKQKSDFISYEMSVIIFAAREDIDTLEKTVSAAVHACEGI